MNVGGLFSGIGGFELGLVRAGFEISWMVEIDEFCQKVLKKHAQEYWPNARILSDVTKVTKEQLSTVDLICGGFPCQPFSNAGKRRGKDDDRYLWPEMLRIISELKPRWVIGENVTGFINMELENALIGLEAEGYQVETFVLPVAAIGGWHRRDRIWIVAHTKSIRLYENPFYERSNTKINFWESSEFSSLFPLESLQYPTEPSYNRKIDGIPRTLDECRIKAIGNSVVPQIPEIFGRFILEIEHESKTS